MTHAPRPQAAPNAVQGRWTGATATAGHVSIGSGPQGITRMSQAGSLTDATPAFTPIASGERITALDVVRGFALIGIFLMNIEWFNRPIAELGQGLPATATGANYWAGYLIYILVQGKFWTMFSLLFGMGF